MTTKLYDVSAAVSSYTTRDGKQKSNWENIGAIFKNDNGNLFMTLKSYINIAALPRNEGSENVILSLFKPRVKDTGNNTQNSNSDSFENFENNPYNSNNTNGEEIPF